MASVDTGGEVRDTSALHAGRGAPHAFTLQVVRQVPHEQHDCLSIYGSYLDEILDALAVARDLKEGTKILVDDTEIRKAHITCIEHCTPLMHPLLLIHRR